MSSFYSPDLDQNSKEFINDEVSSIYQKNVDHAYQLFQNLTYDPKNKKGFIDQLIEVRKAVKYTESVAGFFDTYAINKIFAPNIYKVEYASGEPADVIDPIGFQRIEEMLDENATSDEIELELKKLGYVFIGYHKYARTLKFDESVFFLALKAELIRIQTQGITGFDAPVYSNCLEESAEALKGMQSYMQPYFNLNNKQSTALNASIKRAIDFLTRNKNDFDGFDRLVFIQDYVNPMHENLLLFQRDLGIENVSPEKENLFAFDQDASNIFNHDFLNPFFFQESRKAHPEEKIEELGRILFFDPILSGNNKRACASCHQPDHAFAESLKTSMNMDGKGYISRNAPTLVNSAFQNKFQLEGRAENPERQMHLVLFSADEMGNSQANLINTLNSSKEYIELFQEAFNTDAEINFSMVKYALGGYIRSLVALNSTFDKYMRGEISEIAPEVKNGFNLFMGKAVCASCHFAPIFNGTVPPQFSDTEIEVLGVTSTDDFKHPKLDPDIGAYVNGQSEYHKFGFKTPTVRNVEFTSPYMHNGAYADLETVLEFYKRGGGAGLGLDVPHQTLPFDELKLSKKEIQDLVSFMKSLSDIDGVTEIPSHLPKFENEELNARKIGGEY